MDQAMKSRRGASHCKSRSRRAADVARTQALEVARKFGGKLVRVTGGYWTHEGCRIEAATGVPVWKVPKEIIIELVSRNALEWSKFRPESGGGIMPIEVRIATGHART
jgi:hypothetical protein